VKDTYEEISQKSRTGTCRISTLRAIAFTAFVCAGGIGRIPGCKCATAAPGDEVGARSHFGEFTARNLSFLASDLLEGRDTPSRGVGDSVEFIAAQFRSAGLEPAGILDIFRTQVSSRWSKPKTASRWSAREQCKLLPLRENKQINSVRAALNLSRAPVILFDLDCYAPAR